MSSNDEEKAPVPSFTNSLDIWYPDGSIVLIAEGTAFKVHTSILAQNSEVFRDMCSIANAKEDSVENPAEASYAGCPALSLQDAASDLEHFLKSMYLLRYFEPGVKTSFDKVSAVLRLSTKYIAPDLRKRAADFIATVYPSTLTKWDQRSTLRLVHPSKSEYLSYISLAIDTDFSVILPAIFYDMSKRPPAEVISAFRKIAGLKSWDTVLEYLLGVANLRELEIKYLLGFMDPAFFILNCDDGEECDDAEECEQRIKDTATVGVLESSATIAAMVQKCTIKSYVGIYARSLQLCDACTKNVENAIYQGRERIWKELPSIFGMSEWNVLRAEQAFFVEGDLPASAQAEDPLH